AARRPRGHRGRRAPGSAAVALLVPGAGPDEAADRNRPPVRSARRCRRRPNQRGPILERTPMNPPSSDTRAAILARTVQRSRNHQLGRTALMKLTYFLQELEGLRLGFHFTLYTYGPFQSEVLSDLATAISLEYVQEEVVLYPRGYGYRITPGPSADE